MQAIKLWARREREREGERANEQESEREEYKWRTQEPIEFYLCVLLCIFSVPLQKKCQVRLPEYIDLSVFHARQSFGLFERTILHSTCTANNIQQQFTVCVWL